MAYEKITTDHILQVVKTKILKDIPPRQAAQKYFVEIEGQHWPVKYLVREAHLLAYGTTIDERFVSTDARRVLSSLGFEIIKSGDSEESPFLKLIAQYKQKIKSNKNSEELYKWKLVRKNLGKPNLNADNFTEEINGIDFGNLIYGVGIGAIKHLAKDKPEEYRTCFKTLFDEDLSITTRVSKFRAQVLKVYRQLVPNTAHSDHHDERTIATLLSYKWPNKYAFYIDSTYQKLCKFLDIKSEKPGAKYQHYLEILLEFKADYIEEDTELLALKKGFLTDDCYPDENNLVLAQDIFYQILNPKGLDTAPLLDETKQAPAIKNNNMHALNTILFGPPGTGKTFNTISESIKIIEEIDEKSLNARYQTRADLKNKFDFYLANHQISFTTFHQNFAYEDFIEGIKPVLVEHAENSEVAATTEVNGQKNAISYELVDGIFKRSAIEAKTYATFLSKGVSWKRRLSEKELQSAKFFKMSLGNTQDEEEDQVYEYCIKENLIALGYGDDIDFTGAKDRAAITQKYTAAEVKLKSKNDFKVSAVERFLNWMTPGDIVLISAGNHKIRAIGKIGPEGYFCNPSAPVGYYQFRNVEWLMVNQEVPVAEVYEKVLSQQTIYEMTASKIKRTFFVDQTKSNSESKNKRNHVLIIDEINRGNIAGIFGELITLIEDSKREGASEALSVTLPYSKTLFSVPSNLYILGTMNTADRSIEALDTALRRRFTFLEMAPMPSLLHPKNLICNFWNKPEHIDLDDKTWAKEPYKSLQDQLFNFLGAPANFEAKVIAMQEASERKYWKIEDMQNVSDEEFAGIRMDIMLEVINQRIEKLIDKDHKIGHAYFIAVTSKHQLTLTFKDKIIPLLEEYFFGDFGKIGLVLGASFVTKETNAFEFATFPDYGPAAEQDFMERPVYKIKPSSEWNFESIYTQKN